MIEKRRHIIENTLKEMILEQAPSDSNTEAGANSDDTLFTPAEEKFLGKFDAYGTNHLGIIYSTTDIGIREFIGRSGVELDLTPGILLSLIRRNVVKIVPYTGFGKNDDYTIELQLSLNDVKGLGADDKEALKSKEASAGGAPPAEPAMPEAPMEPAPDLAWVVKYGDVLKESATIAKQLISEKKKTKETSNTKIYSDQSRILKRLPKHFVTQLKKIIELLDKKTNNVSEKERLIADILDNLQINFNLSPKHITKSYEFHKSQKRLQKFIDKDK
jgi:hypothetical protein